jgi:hypothetical protein
MKIAIILVILALLYLLFSGSKTGYTSKNGSWYWVTIDEYNGKREHLVQEADYTSFEVLSCKQFAKDQRNVYYEGKIIKRAKASTIKIIGDDKSNYLADDQLVFFRTEIIINADPATFEVLEPPYSRDKNDVYCGTIPMMLAKEYVSTFKVTNSDPLMKGMISTIKLSHFLEFNPRYEWITKSNPDIEFAITGEWGTGEALNKKFKGLHEVTAEK